MYAKVIFGWSRCPGVNYTGGGYCQSLSDQSVNASVNVNSSANSRPSLRTNLSNSDSPSPMSGTSSSGSSTHHSHHPSSPLSFIPGLKLSFSANPSRRSILFFQGWLIPQTVYRYFWTYPFFTFVVFCFPLVSFCFRAVDLADLCQLSSAR